MNNLLIDIGNSDIKIATGNSKNLHTKFISRFSYSKTNFKKDFSYIFKKNNLNISFSRIGISVLSNSNKEFLKNFLTAGFDINPVFIDRHLKLPVKIAYSRELGSDRICSAAAVSEMFIKKNFLVIDFGTATTYTLTLNKTITAGLISPGIKTSMQSLTEKTSLPDIDLRFPKNLFNINTKDNIKAGVLYQSLFSCERIINEAKRKYKDLFVVATGGFSKLIFKKTNTIDIVDELLVLRGINFIISK